METETNDEVKEVTKEEVDRMLRHHIYTAAGIGLIPLPLLDIVALTGVQLNLVRKLAKMYSIPFSKEKVKNILSALIGGTLPAATGTPLASLAKGIPIVGQSIGVVTMPIIAASTTYAVGKVFIRHFASGGTFLTFDIEKVRDYYHEMYNKGKDVAADIKKYTKAKQDTETGAADVNKNAKAEAKTSAPEKKGTTAKSKN